MVGGYHTIILQTADFSGMLVPMYHLQRDTYQEPFIYRFVTHICNKKHCNHKTK